MVQLLCTIGVGKLVSLVVLTNGIEQSSLKANDITIVLESELGCRSGAIAVSLALRGPGHQQTAAC